MSYRVRRVAPALILAATLTAAWPVGVQSPAAAAVQEETATIKTEANMRTRPSTTIDSTVETVLPTGATVEVVCWTEGEPTYGTDKFGSMWLFVNQKTRSGWVHSFLVSPVNVPPCSDSDTLVFDNCDEARAAGAAPVLAGRPGYGLHLDRDRDGVGCEVSGWNR